MGLRAFGFWKPQKLTHPNRRHSFVLRDTPNVVVGHLKKASESFARIPSSENPLSASLAIFGAGWKEAAACQILEDHEDRCDPQRGIPSTPRARPDHLHPEG